MYVLQNYVRKMFKFYFSYSSVKFFEKCPYAYKLHYVDRLKPIELPSKYHAISGIVIQKVFENFYNDRWYLKGVETSNHIHSKLPDIYNNTLSKNYVDWEQAPKTSEELFLEIKEQIAPSIKAIKENKLIGQKNQSEKRVKMFFHDNIVQGSIDFVIQKDEELILLDGKDVKSENKVKFLDSDQLFLYSVLLANQIKQAPTKIGFLCWRLGRVEWVDFSIEQLKTFKEEFNNRVWAIRKAFKWNKFKPTPSAESCIFCPYKQQCEFACLEPDYEKLITGKNTISL